MLGNTFARIYDMCMSVRPRELDKTFIVQAILSVAFLKGFAIFWRFEVLKCAFVVYQVRAIIF